MQSRAGEILSQTSSAEGDMVRAAILDAKVSSVALAKQNEEVGFELFVARLGPCDEIFPVK
jgi:hypothetical protein